MEKSMTRTRVNNRWLTEIPTHYIIGCEWDWKKVNWLEKIVWAVVVDKNNTLEQVLDANANWIHIELVWSFNQENPTFKQYDSLIQLVKRIKVKYPNIEIKYHSDFQTKSCPWIKFNKDFMNMKTFNLSRYYSPEANQPRYYNGKSHAEDVCMNCWCGKDLNWNITALYDCTKPANGITLKPEQRWKVIACPPEYPLWTKFYFEWIWEVTCVDRWWAIKWNRIDVRCWYGMDALNKRNTCPTWPRRWYVLSTNK
jgi:3D (Asp-Asp-Asp) domain-containing protein